MSDERDHQPGTSDDEQIEDLDVREEADDVKGGAPQSGNTAPSIVPGGAWWKKV